MILALGVDGIGSWRETRKVSDTFLIAGGVVDSIKEAVAAHTNLSLGNISASVFANQLYAYQLCTPLPT